MAQTPLVVTVWFRVRSVHHSTSNVGLVVEHEQGGGGITQTLAFPTTHHRSTNTPPLAVLRDRTGGHSGVKRDGKRERKKGKKKKKKRRNCVDLVLTHFPRKETW